MAAWINFPTVIMLGIMFVAALAFVLGAMLWLKRLRASLAGVVSEALSRQIQHGQKVEEALCVMQQKQKKIEEQLHVLAQAQSRARADINALAHRFEQREITAEAQNPQGRVLH